MAERRQRGSLEAEISGLDDPQAEGSPAVIPAAASGPPATQVECPFCAELISSRAKKCRHCSETIDVTLRRAEEALRASERSPHVYMNAGGGGGAAVSSANGANSALRPFNHLLHILLSVITLGWWLPVYLLLYLLRNKNYYY